MYKELSSPPLSFARLLLFPHLLIPPHSPAFLSSVSLLSSLLSFSLTPSFLPPPLSFLIPPPLPLLPVPPSPYSLLSCLFSFRSPLPPPPYILLPSTLYPAPRKLFLFISSPAPYTLPQVSLASPMQPLYIRLSRALWAAPAAAPLLAAWLPHALPILGGNFEHSNAILYYFKFIAYAIFLPANYYLESLARTTTRLEPSSL